MHGPPNFGDPRTRLEQREAQRRRAEAKIRATPREEAARQAQIKAQQAEEAERTRRERLERYLAQKNAVRMAREEKAEGIAWEVDKVGEKEKKKIARKKTHAQADLSQTESG
ncbi:hypothetical protein F5148DRAFT_1288175 [Russula earlei]|uniref:Uncharacterized protein n=1 Tax=Russula earlei TaxID=71964 RepID=A0ACC0U132_9AGAM|nr:hypothetical protein F5148DRAFT_1288175 [Russula earlei]